ncbi:MAG: sigma-70 family RNA polymerase sigma factor [Planctomycetaceae bacterium]
MSVHAEKPEAVDPELWVDQFGDYLYRYAYSRLRDANAAEEVLQETFLAGIRFLEQFSGEGSQRAWLLGILKRKIVDYVRRRTRYERDNSFCDGDDPSARLFAANGSWSEIGVFAASPDHIVESQELWQVVRECLSHLPAGQADVFTLSVMEDMPAEDICQNLEITPNNFWVRLHRARLGLASCVGSRWFQETEVTQHAQ